MKAGEIAILILPPKLKLRGSASAVYAEASNCRQRRSWGGGSKLGDWSKRELLLLHLAYGNLHCSFSELEGSSVKQSRPYSTFHCRWISEVLCMHCQGIRVFAGGEAKAESESSWNWAAMRALLYGVWWSRLQRAWGLFSSSPFDAVGTQSMQLAAPSSQLLTWRVASQNTSQATWDPCFVIVLSGGSPRDRLCSHLIVQFGVSFFQKIFYLS